MGAPKISPQDGQHENLGFKASAIADSEAGAQRLAQELEASLNGWIQLSVGWGREPAGSSSQIIFVDADCAELDAKLAGLERGASTLVYLVVREGQEVPAALVEGRVDDVLVRPFRSLEVLSKLRQLHKTLAHREALEVNSSYAKLVELLQEDLKLAERLQKQRLPRRFPEVKGFRVTSRYLAGERSGGDYIDLAETRDGQSLAIVMTDASTYRLSSAVLDAVTRRLAHLPADEVRSCVTAARRIRDGVLAALGDRDQLSLFYAVVSRKDFKMRFVNLGGTRVFYAPPGKPFSEVKGGQADPILRAVGVRTENEGELTLEPEGRLALVSDGFVESLGGAEELLRVFNQHRNDEAAESLNELVFKTKRPLASADDLPAQDCTAALFDVDSRLIRLA